jgi:uncharacterized protein YecT (DUF1311 family)
MSGFLVALLAGACLLSTPALAKELPVKTLSIDRKTDAYEIAIEYPATGNGAIDGEIAAWAKQQADDFVKLATRTDRQPGENAYGLSESFEVARNDGAIFAVLFSAETDTGGAHPNHDFATFNFEVPSGWRLYLPEIFDGHKALARISALAVADLTKQFGDSHNGGGDPDWVRNGAGPDWDNFRDFILQKDKLEIHYPDYQVAAYAEGDQETDIPLATLKGLTRTDRHAPAASFDCAAAATASEKAICSDVTLARLDRDVAEAYLRGVKFATEDAAKETLKTEQRGWLGQRDAACPNAAVTCLTTAYRDRLAKLEKAAE